jgi:hypothetical protein
MLSLGREPQEPGDQPVIEPPEGGRQITSAARAAETPDNESVAAPRLSHFFEFQTWGLRPRLNI